MASPAQDGPEFQDIVCGTEEHPFAAHLPHPAQQELSIAEALFDLAKDWLQGGFAPHPAEYAYSSTFTGSWG